jgi:hypothetical protein
MKKGLVSSARSKRDADRSAAAILSGGGPVDGERVLFCAHADLSDGVHLPGTFHWHRFVPHETVTDKRTGDTFDVEWFAVCQKCQIEMADKPCTLVLTQDAEWIGQSPNITRVI